MADGTQQEGVQRFRELIDFAPDAMVVVDEAGRIRLANRQIEQLLGYEPAELVGQPLELLLPERFRSRHVEHRRAYVQDPRSRAMGANLALFARRKDGTELPVEISLSPVHEPDGLLTLAALRDISDRRRMQEALRASEERLRLLVESVSEYAIYMLDAEGHVRTWSVGAERIYGYAASQILGRHVSTFYPPEDVVAGRVERELAAAVCHGQHREESVRVRADGSRFQAEVAVTPLFDGDGGLRGFANVARDITERKRAEEERDRATQAREELLSLVTHDLQNSVNVLTLNAQLLLRVTPETEAEERMRRYGVRLAHSTATMSRLIRDLLDLQKIDQGSFRIEPEVEAVAGVVHDAIEPMLALAAEKSVRFELRVSDGVESVRCDHERLVQVLQNLVGNAIKFVPAGGRVGVEVERKPHELQFAVRDNGAGLPPEELPYVFDRHWRSPSHALRRGSGLGLYIVKTIVESHGGKVWVESAPGQGASFLFTVPTGSDA